MANSADSEPVGSFSTATDRRQLTAGQLFTAFFLVASGVMLIVNLVWLPFAEERIDHFPPIVASAIVAAGSVVLLRRLRRRWQRLTVDASGITLTGTGDTGSWTWGDIRGLAVVDGGANGQRLSIEDERAALADQRRPRTAALHRALTEHGAAATVIWLRDFEAGNMAIIDAIRHYSGGRFPDQERDGGLRLPRR